MVMRCSHAVVLLAVISVLSGSLLHQQSTRTSKTPQRDQKAVSVLTQCLTSAGGQTAIAAIRDYKATGIVTYFWADEDVMGSTTIKGRGVDQFRIDSELSSGDYSYIVSKGSGEIIDVRGIITQISSHNAATTTNLSFPFVEIATTIQDTSYTIIYVGLVEKSGHQAIQIRTSKVVMGVNNTADNLRPILTTRDFFIDSQTYQVLSTQDMIDSNGNANKYYPHEVLFSNYVFVNGILVPEGVTEKIGGQYTWTIQLSQVGFNVGLTDADFTF
jgi:hypothetical protein